MNKVLLFLILLTVIVVLYFSRQVFFFKYEPEYLLTETNMGYEKQVSDMIGKMYQNNPEFFYIRSNGYIESDGKQFPLVFEGTLENAIIVNYSEYD